MTTHPKLDLGIAATSTVLTADQLLRALEASHEHKTPHAKKHLAYAAIGAAVAVGAIELLRRDEQAQREAERDEDGEDSDLEIREVEEGRHHHHHDDHIYEHDHDSYHHHSRSRSNSHSSDDHALVLAAAEHDRARHSQERHRSPPGHKRRLAEEIAGVYALGEEIMGNKKHHVAHIVAEALAAVAAYKDGKERVERGVE